MHFIEWQTPTPVTVNAFNLFAGGDGPTAPFPTQREFAQFVLKAMSSPLATNYDLTLYTLVVTNHPYVFVDPVNSALVATNITPVTAQYFRAEFTQYNAGNNHDGPRILELDGFGTRPSVCDPLPAGLVSSWAAEGNVNDSFGTNNAMILGSLAYAPGEVGQAWQFDGTLAGVRVPASSSLDVGTNGGLTIEGWIKPFSLTVNEPLAVWNNGTDNLGVHLQLNQPPVWGGNGPGSFFSTISDTVGGAHNIASPANVLSTNSWNHVALTYDRASGMAALYLNGSAVTVQNLGSFTPLTSYDFYLGYSPQDPSFGLYYYTGLMDEMSLYNVALSSNQIAAIYNAGSAGKCAVAPVIVSAPQNETVLAGGTASFSVNATGSQPLSYQWFVNGSNLLAMATNATLTLPNVQVGQSGNSYSVQVSNSAGTTNSSSALLTVTPPIVVLPSTNDLWDVSQGSVVTGTSGAHVPYSDIRDMFGGEFGGVDKGSTVFEDGEPAGFVHYVEWQTPVPVRVNAFNLFAAGDGPEFDNQREFSQFVLKAKSSPLATNFDLTLYTLVVTNHPYTFVDPVNAALVVANITPVTAQNFRAEFTQYTAGRGFDGPRVIELDGYGPNPPVITTQPTNQTVVAGMSTSFSVTAAGSAPFSYQWYLNGSNLLAMATNATLVLTNVQPGQSGNNYSVQVSNSAGLTNSSSALVTVNPAPPAILPSTNDLWDISQGSVVTGTSGAHVPYSDIRDMFGGEFSPTEPGTTVFDDGRPAGFVHYVEWQTPGLVTVSNFNLFAVGDGAEFNNEREFSQFVLKAMSSPLATNYDLTLYTLVVTNHPYTFVDPVNFALVATNIAPVTAQYFRAEFTQYTAGRGFDGPRVIELDGFGTRTPFGDPPPSGLVGWWAAVVNEKDSFGTNNGTFVGRPSFGAGEVGEAFNLNGTSQYVDVPYNAALTATTNLTVEAWIYPRGLNPASASPIVKKSGEGLAQQDGYSLEMNDTGGVAIWGYINGGVGWVPSVPATVPLNQWSHVAGVYDGTNLSMYLNGVLVGAPVYEPGQIVASGNDLQIGHDPAIPSRYFNGLIDEASVYNKALSAAQILAIYNAGSLGKCAVGPVIVSGPQNQTALAGGTVIFNVNTTGSQPLSYQWFVNANNLPGATNATLILANVQPGLSGNNYSVQVSNRAGLTNSGSALLTVNLPPCDPPPSGLVGWWAAEGNANDSFGTNNGVLSGGVSFANGEVGRAFQFDGVTGTVIIPASPSLDVGTNQGLTIEGWIQPADPVANAPLVEWNSGTDQLGSHFWINIPTLYGGGGPGSLFANIVDTTGANHYMTSGGGLFSTNSLAHVALSYDQASGMATLYCNGTVVAVQALGVFTPRTVYNLNLGYRPASASFLPYYYGGLMDEMSIYSRTLSATEIAAIYNAGNSGKCAVAPVIVSAPQNQTVLAGGTASFSVNATGSQPLGYQWFVNASSLPAATNATLTLTNVQFGQSGNNYSVQVSNRAGTTNGSSALLTVNAASCVPPPSGLVSWWQAEGNANDSFGTNNGTLVGGVSFTNGEAGEAFNISQGNYVSVPDSPSLNPTSAMTVEAWIFPRNIPGDPGVPPIVKKAGLGGSAQAAGFGLELRGANQIGFGVYVNNNWLQAPQGPIALNTWTHAAGVYDGTNVYLYINGVLVGATRGGGAIQASPNPLQIGNDPSNPSRYFNGLIDEAALYQTALSAAQIRAIYDAGSADKCAVPPVIVSAPQNQTVTAGNTVSFSVNTIGSQPLSYQWFVNASNLPAATNATLTLTNVQLAQSGNNYSVQVSNNAGSTNSSSALLTVYPLSCDPPPSGLVSWWAAEGNANDSFGTNNGTLHDGASFTNGEVGQAFRFDGVSGYVSVPASASLNVGAGGGFTIEGWINPVNPAISQPLCEWNNDTGDLGVGAQFWLIVNPATGPNCLYGNLSNNGTNFFVVSPPGLVQPGVFQHVALSYNKASGTARLYYNGAMVGQATTTPGYTPGTTSEFDIGKRISGSQAGPPSSLLFAGLMDEMSLYNTALSANQIQAIYNAGSAGKCEPAAPSITLEPVGQSVRPGCTVTFTSGASGSGALNYQWRLNGSNLAAQNSTSLTLVNIQATNFGNYTMIASNAGGSATSTVAVLALDHLPVPGSITLQRFPGGGVRMNTGDLLAGATDADGDPLSLAGVASNSAAGGVVTLSGPSIYYFPAAPGLTNTDSFNYTISDGHCNGTAVGAVQVEVRSDLNPASRVTIMQTGNGPLQVIFDGMPGVAYRVQTTASLAPPDWQDVTTLVAGQCGTCIYNCPTANGPVQYFRSVSP